MIASVARGRARRCPVRGAPRPLTGWPPSGDFEETGLLLAYAPARRPPASRGAERRTLATDRLVYYAHGITPEERPVPYDARSFVGAAFPESAAEPDGIEAVTCCWLRPAVALELARTGALTLERILLLPGDPGYV